MYELTDSWSYESLLASLRTGSTVVPGVKCHLRGLLATDTTCHRMSSGDFRGALLPSACDLAINSTRVRSGARDPLHGMYAALRLIIIFTTLPY